MIHNAELTLCYLLSIFHLWQHQLMNFNTFQKKLNGKNLFFLLIWDKSLCTKLAELWLTPNLLLDSGRVTWAPQMWAVRSPDEVKASSLSGWNLIEFTDPWWPKYCSAHCWVCIDQILAEWSTKEILKVVIFLQHVILWVF